MEQVAGQTGGLRPRGFLVTNPNAQPLQTSHHRATFIERDGGEGGVLVRPPPGQYVEVGGVEINAGLNRGLVAGDRVETLIDHVVDSSTPHRHVSVLHHPPRMGGPDDRDPEERSVEHDESDVEHSALNASHDVTSAPTRSAGSRCSPRSAEEQAEAYAAVLPLLASGEITPAHDRSFPPEQASEALRHLVEDRPFGKVTLTVGAYSRPRAADS